MIKFTGVIPALVTPLSKNNTVNIPELKKLIDHLIVQQADGLYIGGATGEGISLCEEQRMILCEESIKAINKRTNAIIHIASTDFESALRLARHAEKSGADAISAIPPIFYHYDENDVFNYYKRLAESVNLPLIIYFNPNAGFNINAEFAKRCFEIDNITGIKWTSSNYYGMMRLKDLTHGEMNIINGPDEMFICGLISGADGGIGTTYNFLLDRFKSIYNSFILNDIESARKVQFEVNRIISAVLDYELIPAVKVILTQIGFDVGYGTYPFKRYSKSTRQKIITAVKNAGFNISS